MLPSKPTEHIDKVWKNLVQAENNFVAIRMQFMVDWPNQNQIETLRKGLSFPGQRGCGLRLLRDCVMARWDVHQSSMLAELIQVFPVLVELASVGHSDIGLVREVLLLLPRDYLIENIERQAEPYLASGHEEEYRRYFELYDLLDRGLVTRLAARALASSKPEIREIGEEYRYEGA
jgi:hypothetical protein